MPEKWTRKRLRHLDYSNKKKKVKAKKTQYCLYWYRCDREEDCFNGAYCPVYKFNPNCATKEEQSYDDPDKN